MVRNPDPNRLKYRANAHLSRERHANLCKFDPYTSTDDFFTIRGDYDSENEQFFVFRDKSPVKPCHMRATLKAILRQLRLNASLYDTHSFRAGRATDLQNFGYDIEEIKKLGRWRSNAIYQYLKQI